MRLRLDSDDVYFWRVGLFGLVTDLRSLSMVLLFMKLGLGSFICKYS